MLNVTFFTFVFTSLCLICETLIFVIQSHKLILTTYNCNLISYIVFVFLLNNFVLETFVFNDLYLTEVGLKAIVIAIPKETAIPVTFMLMLLANPLTFY